MKNRDCIEFEVTLFGVLYENRYFPNTDIMTSRQKEVSIFDSYSWSRDSKDAKKETKLSSEFKHAMRQWKIKKYNGK